MPQKPTKKYQKHLVISESIRKNKKKRAKIEQQYLDEHDMFDHVAPPCMSCAAFDYTACNANEAGDVIACSKCPTIKDLH